MECCSDRTGCVVCAIGRIWRVRSRACCKRTVGNQWEQQEKMLETKIANEMCCVVPRLPFLVVEVPVDGHLLVPISHPMPLLLTSCRCRTSLYYIVVVVRHTILSAPLLNNNSSSGCWDRITTLADTMRHSRPTLSLLCRV